MHPNELHERGEQWFIDQVGHTLKAIALFLAVAAEDPTLLEPDD